MPTEAMRRAYQREVWIEIFAEATGVADDPCRYDREADLEAMADRALAAEAQGVMVQQTWLIIPFHGTGGWDFRAEALGAVPHGCVHTGRGSTMTLAMAQAIEEHQAGTACIDVR